MRGNLAAADDADQMLEVWDFLIGKFIQQAGYMMFEPAAVFKRLVAENVEHLRIDHCRNEIECRIHIGHDAEKRRLAITELIQLQFIAFHHVPHFLDIKGRKARAAGNQNGFRGFTRCLLSRTFSYFLIFYNFAVEFVCLSAYNEVGKSLLFKKRQGGDETMIAKAFIDNAKVMSKGQVTIPKDVREALGVSSGDRVSFIVEGNTVRMVNSAVYAMQVLQGEMAGEAEHAGLTSDDDVMALVKEMRDADRA